MEDAKTRWSHLCAHNRGRTSIKCKLGSPRLGNAPASALNVGRIGEYHAHDAAALCIILQDQCWAFEGLQNDLLGLDTRRTVLRGMCWMLQYNEQRMRRTTGNDEGQGQHEALWKHWKKYGAGSKLTQWQATTPAACLMLPEHLIEEAVSRPSKG